jgi:DNA-binding MarR family transcriptional regulator
VVLRVGYTIKVRLNISETEKNPSRRGRSPAEDLLVELTSWGSRDRLRMFATWHRGSLSLIHLTVLTLLEVEGPVPMGRLAEWLDVSHASVTGIVDRMEERGLVERRRAADDRRVISIHLTDTGASVSRDLLARRQERLARILGELTDAEATSLLKGLRALRSAREHLAEVDAEAGPKADAEVDAGASGAPPGEASDSL